MVGRTPEYLGKKIEAYVVKMAMLVTLVFPLIILMLTGISSIAGFGISSISNTGPHGLTQILYAFTSMAGNNGSAFGGLNGNTLWYNTSGAMTMLIGRFFMIIPMLAIAGNLAKKKTVPASAGTFPVTTPLFTVLLVSVILIVGALTFFPALSLGPVLEHLLMMAEKKSKSLWDAKIIRRALVDAVVKLDPRTMMKNPVMFVVEVGSVVTTLLLFREQRSFAFNLQITLWLWFTVLFANFAEAMAEGRGKAQADTLRKARSETEARRLLANGTIETVPSAKLRSGDNVMVAANELVPGEGEVIEGVASVDESAITGESAPVIREAGGDRSAVTGGTRVLSDVIKVRITSNPGETFLDRMIALVEGAERQKTPNEIALNILLAGLTIIFLLAVVTLQPFAIYSGSPQ